MGARTALRAAQEEREPTQWNRKRGVVTSFGDNSTFVMYMHFVLSLLEGWGRTARSKTPPGVEPPWSARNFLPYWSQLLSKEAQRGAAIEILNRVDGEAADREAARLRSASG